jgi:hypothetical protein
VGVLNGKRRRAKNKLLAVLGAPNGPGNMHTFTPAVPSFARQMVSCTFLDGAKDRNFSWTDARGRGSLRDARKASDARGSTIDVGVVGRIRVCLIEGRRGTRHPVQLRGIPTCYQKKGAE